LSNAYPPVREFFLLGKTLKSHGTSGHLRLMIEDRLKGYVKAGSFVFIDLNGSRVPFQVKEVDEVQHFVMLLEGINGKQESDTLTGKEIWVPMEQVKTRHLKSPRNINEKWEDYEIRDEKTGTSFHILRTEEYPQQLMAVVLLDEREILIPLHEQLIMNIDRDQKIISMEIPEGLLDL
jgi:16S rRNA processing protein RimM